MIKITTSLFTDHPSSARCCLSASEFSARGKVSTEFIQSLMSGIGKSAFLGTFWARTKSTSLAAHNTYKSRLNLASEILRDFLFGCLPIDKRYELTSIGDRVSSRWTRYFLFAKRKYPKKVLFRPLHIGTPINSTQLLPHALNSLALKQHRVLLSV